MCTVYIENYTEKNILVYHIFTTTRALKFDLNDNHYLPIKKILQKSTFSKRKNGELVHRLVGSYIFLVNSMCTIRTSLLHIFTHNLSAIGFNFLCLSILINTLRYITTYLLISTREINLYGKITYEALVKCNGLQNVNGIKTILTQVINALNTKNLK